LLPLSDQKNLLLLLFFCFDQICSTEPLHSHFQRTLSLVSGRSRNPQVFAASGSWIELYMFPLTFDESVYPCIHNYHGSSQRYVNVTSVPAASSFFQKALASVSQASFALPHISISSLEIYWCAGT
jgi:hypothetical protein